MGSAPATHGRRSRIAVFDIALVVATAPSNVVFGYTLSWLALRHRGIVPAQRDERTPDAAGPWMRARRVASRS
jgi:hypothetical protein